MPPVPQPALRRRASHRGAAAGHEKVVNAVITMSPPFGIGADPTSKTWRGVFRQLAARGLLAVDHGR